MRIPSFLRVFTKCTITREYRRMSGCDVFSPPENCKGMTVLDREKFTKEVRVPCLTVASSQNLHKLIPCVKSMLLKLKHIKPVRESSDGNKILFLNPQEFKDWSDLPADKLSVFGVDETALASESVEIKYENYPLKELLKGIIPEDLEGVSSFSQVGHIVHVNLRDEMIPYKSIVGQVMLDKVPNCKSVVNKLNTIDNVYRNFQMELLAGEDNYQTMIKENGVRFEFDFSKVYWNSRLSTEHERIVLSVKPSDIIYDVFAGVGPFAVPIAKKMKQCRVLANDLNPESAKWLEHNKKLNKIGDNLVVFNKDAKCFILDDIRKDLIEELVKPESKTIRIVMNLPELGKEFLKYFVGLLQNEAALTAWNPSSIPVLVNVYCFVRGEDLKAAARESVEKELQRPLSDDQIEGIYFVRNVAPNKDMMRVSFYLTKEILGAEPFYSTCEKKRKLEDSTTEESQAKKQSIV